MGKSFGRIRRFFTTLALTLGVALALPGCGKVQTPQEMSTDVADNTDSFADALKKKDLERMYQIRDEAKDKYKDLDDEENRRIDNGEDVTDVMVQRVLLDNQIAMYNDIINKLEQNNNTIPNNSSLAGKIGDGVDFLAGHALDFLDGDPIYNTTAIATEYAKTYPDYSDIALADQELFKVWYGEDFTKVQEAKGNYGKVVEDTLKKIARWTGRKFRALQNEFKQGLQDYDRDAQTDNKGNYIIESSDAIKDAEFKQDLLDRGILGWQEREGNPEEFDWVIHVDKVPDEETMKRLKEIFPGITEFQEMGQEAEEEKEER